MLTNENWGVKQTFLISNDRLGRNGGIRRGFFLKDLRQANLPAILSPNI